MPVEASLVGGSNGHVVIDPSQEPFSYTPCCATAVLARCLFTIRPCWSCSSASTRASQCGVQEMHNHCGEVVRCRTQPLWHAYEFEPAPLPVYYHETLAVRMHLSPVECILEVNLAKPFRALWDLHGNALSRGVVYHPRLVSVLDVLIGRP